MKKIIFIFSVLTLGFVSCDKVENPRVVKEVAIGSKFITKNNFAVSGFRKVLLEDYTGMTCTACPPAAVTAKNLASQYSGSVIVVAVHSGFFALPKGTYTLDLRSDASDKWYANYTSSNPYGMVNRKDYGQGVILGHTSWGSAVATAVTEPQVVQLKVTTNYDTAVKALNTDVTAIFKTTYANAVKVTAVLLEEDLVGKQLDNGVIIDEYEFEHVLRGAISNDFPGSDLKATPIAAMDSAKVSFNNFALGSMTYVYDPASNPPKTKPVVVNDKNTYVVVFASDAATNAVLQVEKVKIR